MRQEFDYQQVYATSLLTISFVIGSSLFGIISQPTRRELTPLYFITVKP